MAITCVIGLDGGTTTETEWARYEYARGYLGSFEGVVSGGVVTVGAGVRELSVSAFEAIVPGVLASSDAPEVVSFAANDTGTNRLDYLVLAVNWSGTASTAGDIAAVTGGAALPALTRTLGGLWQMPLAQVTVRPGVTAIAAADIVPVGGAPVWEALTLVPAAGWSVTSARAKRLGGLGVAVIELDVTRTGADLTFGTSGGLADTEVISSGLPAKFRPLAPRYVFAVRSGVFSLTWRMNASGSMDITDGMANAVISTGSTIRVAAPYVLD